MGERKRNAALAVRALALCAALLAAGGCSRDDGRDAAEAAPPPYVPESYMKDPEFRGGLTERRKAREAVVVERAGVIAKMKELEAAAGGDAAALATNAEWKALSAELERQNERYDDAQREMLRYVRERIVPPNVKKNAKPATPAKNVEQ